MPRWPTVSWGDAFPEAAKIWSDRNEKTPQDYLRGDDDLVWWKCPLGLHPEVQAALRSKRYRPRCPYCAPGSSTFVAEQALDAIHPDLVRWWSPLNKIAPNAVRPGSARKIWWQCPVGAHDDFERTIFNHVQIRTCPQCSGVRPSADLSFASEHPDLARDWSELNDNGPHEYLPVSGQSVWWKCRDGIHGDYERRILDQVSRQGRCRYCTGHIGGDATAENSLSALHPSLAKEWAPENQLSPSQVGERYATAVAWRCRDDRHPHFTAPIRSRLNGTGCPVCAGRIVHETTSLGTLHPEIAIEWSPANSLSIFEVSERHPKPALWVCPVGHPMYSRTVGQRLRGRGCPICVSLGCQRPEIAAEWSPRNDRTPFDVTVKNGYLAEWVCSRNPDHLPWIARVATRSNGSGCPACTLKHRSAIELRLAHELIPFYENNINDIRVQGVKRFWSCDVVLRSHKIVVEYDGAFYHSGVKRQAKDLRKTEDLEAAGWTVMRVRERPLPLLGPHDVQVSPAGKIKPVADAVLAVLGPLTGLGEQLVHDYLTRSDPMNSEAAELFIEELKQEQQGS